MPVELNLALPVERLPPNVEAAAYFTVCEALTNVSKHARASRAWVNAEHRENQLVVEIGDDGAAERTSAGSGLQGLRDRVAAVNGTLEIDSRRDSGTIMRARMPLADLSEEASGDSTDTGDSTPRRSG